MEEMKKKRVLEVGNVLRYYYPVRHDTLDKYEFGDGVLSLDIVDFHPKEKYDLIVTISTLEHVGWDEEPQNPKKLDAAFQNLVDNCLAPGGVLVITLPIGYNSYVDELLSLQKTIPGEKYFLKRKAFSEWREVPYEEVRGMKYNSPFPSSNAICISIYQKMNS
jgi:SAM-dependent methyltransferase